MAFESSVAIIYTRFDQSSADGFDELDGLLCVQRGLKFKPGRNRLGNSLALQHDWLYNTIVFASYKT